METHPTEIDKYEIINHLGNGYFSNVYLANDRALNAKKAIKVLDVPDPNNFIKGFEEAQILNKCKHKHIVKVNEANIYDLSGKLKVIIDMEYIDGGSLESLISKQFISVTEASNYIIDILFGLEFAHNQGVLHRDVKPANIMISNNSAKLSDFGLSTEVGSILEGSPKGYKTHLAPEYFTTRKTTELTDVFAVGITLFRIINNISNWHKTINNVKSFYDKIVTGNLIKAIGYVPYVPKKMKRIINKACQADIKKRFQSSLKMRQALEKLSPSISWKEINRKNWNGTCCKSGMKHEICLYVNRTYVKVDINKNNRRSTKDCMQFRSMSKAYKYMYSHIAETTFM